MYSLSIAVTTMALLSLVTAAPRGTTKRTTDSKSTIPELSLTAQLQLADIATDRYALLNDTDFVFDYDSSVTGMANRKSYPALVGTGGSMAVATFPPCSIAALHVHPRSSELFVVVSGRILTEMVPESGVVTANGTQRVIPTELHPKQMTVFPQGSYHTQINPDCTPALTVASFNSEDPGAGLTAPGLFALSDDFVVPNFGQAFDGEDVDRIRHLLPQQAIFTIESCLKTCGIRKRGV
ncbi:RmlC-like cupin domain-containing protein [Coniochaeta sp. 2T2.1]|nr:RmlC-like cupin domain-containing protein [Coniochaeta sp. 2T2.1]